MVQQGCLCAFKHQKKNFKHQVFALCYELSLALKNSRRDK
jgi:hypothetical protein